MTTQQPDALAADHSGDATDMVGRWYMLNKMGMATLCANKADAQQEAADAQRFWPHMGPHRAVQLVEAADVEAMRAGYAAARLEIESLQARIKAMAEEHADELMVAHMAGRSQAAQQPAPSAAVEVLDALNCVDDFIARCNGDDRGACESVNVLRRAFAAHGQAPAGAAGESRWDQSPCKHCGETEGEHFNVRCRHIQGETRYTPTTQPAPAATPQPAPQQEAQEPYSIDVDPQGIRALVADAITGALAFGAQGTNAPPDGHWLAPFWAAARAEREAAPVADLHPKTSALVQRFAAALTEKLAAAEKKYGYSDGWASPDWMGECRQKLVEHLAKGDPRDVAAYCAFLWHHRESTTAPASQGDALDAARLDWLLLHISGAEFRRIGVHYSGNARRADVDAARKQGANHD